MIWKLNLFGFVCLIPNRSRDALLSQVNDFSKGFLDSFMPYFCRTDISHPPIFSSFPCSNCQLPIKNEGSTISPSHILTAKADLKGNKGKYDFLWWKMTAKSFIWKVSSGWSFSILSGTICQAFFVIGIELVKVLILLM